jgi:ABC-type transport system substrate-binding protein
MDIGRATSLNSVAIPPHAMPVYKYPNVPLDDNQMVIWPVDQRGDIEASKAGSVKTRYWSRYTHMPPFQLTIDSTLVQGVALGFDVNDDNTVFTMHLDPDAVFTDGSPLTAERAKASLEFGTAPEQQASWGGLINFIKEVKGMPEVGKGDASEAEGLVALDDNTLQFTTSVPHPAFPLIMARVQFGIYNVDAIEADSDWKLHVPGIGPFKVEMDPNSTEAVVTMSDNWWRDPPTLAGLSMPVVPDAQTQMIMYENGEIDVGPNTQVREDPSHPLFNDMSNNQSGGYGYYFLLHLNKPPFEDKKVRMALTHAVDMQSIVPALFPGSSTAAGIINGDLACNDPNVKPYRYDPAYARQLLSESTYGSAANLPPIQVSLRWVGAIQTAEVMQEQWRDNLGVELIITRRERGQSIPPESNMKRRSRGTSNPDYGGLVWELIHSESPLQDDIGFEVSEDSGKLDALVDHAVTLALDDPGRCAAFQEAEQLYLDSYLAIPFLGSSGGPGNLVQPWVLGYQAGWYGDWTNLPYWKIGKRDRGLYPNYKWSQE